ncbi:MAG: alpha-amylase family glycosyl hydrolase [Ignavibacteriaceae bacterium]
MRKILRLVGILFVFFSFFVYSQSFAPIPVKGGTQFCYKPNFNFIVKKVTIAGSFNNWNKNQYVMTFDKKKKTWRGIVPLKPEIEYHYKLVINDSLWITDPNAPNVTEDEWRNGIIIPKKYGVPFIAEIYPPQNKRVTKIPEIKATLSGYNSKINPKSIKVIFNGEIIKHNFNEVSSELTIDLDPGIQDGEHELNFSFADKKGNENNGIVHKFFLDRFIHEITTPKFFNNAIMYEVFIRKFLDSDNNGTGDFRGLTEKLDYLKQDLKIDALWLMPFNESTTEHGYNVVDYYSIEADYGIHSFYKQFISEAKKREIKVIMDFVINHTDSSHPFFLDAYKNPESKYTSWYQFRNAENSDWNHFGVDRKMPKLNFDNPEVQEYFIKVAQHWMDPNGDGDFSDGVDGFRCDAAKEVSHKFWNRFRKNVKKVSKDILLLGEVWDNPNFLIPFFKEEFDMLFDYPLYYAMERFFASNDVNSIVNTLTEQREIFPTGYQMVRFLANHDNDRALSKFNESTDKLKQALALLFTLPGTPMIYYGDEIGLTGKIPPENVRQEFDWDRMNKSAKDSTSIFQFYKGMTKLRKENSVLRARDDPGQKSISFLKSTDYPILGYLRYSGDQQTGVFINNSGNDVFSPSLSLTDYKFETNGYEILSYHKTEFEGINNHVGISIKEGKLELNGFTLKNGGFVILRFN